MNLTVIENKAIQSLPVHHKEYLEAKFKPLIKSYSNYDLERGIKNILITAFAEMGIKDAGDDKVITFLRETMLKDLRSPKYEHITLEEVKLFISQGIRGEYGTFKNQLTTINIPNLFFWIKAGITSTGRKLALEQFNKIIQEEENGKPKIDKMILSKDACKKAFEAYKNGYEPMTPWAYYDIINELVGVEYNGFKTLVADLVERKRIFSETTKAHIKAMDQEAVKLSKRGKTAEAEAIIKEITGGFKNSKSLENVQKAALLRYYFDQLIKENKQLEL